MKNAQGYGQNERYSVGTILFRQRYKRQEPARAYIKIASPSKWMLLSRWRWEQVFGVIPPNMGIHHKNGDRCDDNIENLELVTKAEHLRLHRPEFQERALANFIAARRKLRWSTKPKSNKDGRYK